MATIDIPLGPSAFLSQNGNDLNFDNNNKARIGEITYQHNGITKTVQLGFITHLGIVYSGNPNCPNQTSSNWPFYFSLRFSDGTIQAPIFLNKRGILDIQNVQITEAYIHKQTILQQEGLGFEPSKLNIEFEWKKA